ncbi:MAG: hypothetical protein IKP56_00080 [Bacilli bacterium]|nr:hypothetical protein [Bacilli bacterium]
MHKNIGRLKEDEFVYALNNKKAGELSHNMKHILREMFGFFEETDIVKCGLVDHYQKPDFYIEFKGQRKYVSLKSGSSTVIAQEGIKQFLAFLREWHLSINGQKTLLYYHFGDGTMDGSGEKRMDYRQLIHKLGPKIVELNKELNSNKKFVKEFIYRCLFKGTQESNIEADFIYHGDINYGVVCSKEQIFKHVDRRSWDYMDNLHIGPIQFRPHARYANMEIKTEEKRWKVDFWWARLPADLDYIAERYDG